jgi:hypothetical protein
MPKLVARNLGRATDLACKKASVVTAVIVYRILFGDPNYSALKVTLFQIAAQHY